MFAVLGSDHPSFLEAYASHPNSRYPRLFTFTHEFVALAAADGYARSTGKVGCVLVHTDVGTAALGQGLHNASSGRVPILIFAGLAPVTTDGQTRGVRSEHVQWYQDVHRQEDIVRPYVRWSGEIKIPGTTRHLVRRGLTMALGGGAGGPGPVYLTASREILALSTSEEDFMSQMEKPISPCQLGGLSPESVNQIASELIGASRPLVITGYLGRSHAAVQSLIAITNQIGGLRVFDSENRYMSFPADNPAWLDPITGAKKAIREADVILVLDCDVPWIPSEVRFHEDVKVFHIDLDPTKPNMQLFDIEADATLRADSGIALHQILMHINQHPDMDGPDQKYVSRWSDLRESHKANLNELYGLTVPFPEDDTISPAYLFSILPRVLPAGATYIHDAVTLSPALISQLQLTVPGTSFSKGGSGLGWAPGASIGHRLAHPDKFVCCITGDGAFLFSSPASVYLDAERLKAPFLTIILNNGGWKATRKALRDVHPDGEAIRASDEELGIAFGAKQGAAPGYVGIAFAASGGRLWGHSVNQRQHLEWRIAEAVHMMSVTGSGAVIEVTLG